MRENCNEYDALIDLAKKAREKSYSPYSKFSVGAALLCENGEIFCGCNVESASYGASICAERTAIVKAVSEGHRVFKAIAIVGGKHNSNTFEFCSPCGICRQLLMDFCSADSFDIVMSDNNRTIVYTLDELLPLGFGPNNLL